MKKTLLLQSALVAAAGFMLADASHAQVKASAPAITVGGYFTQFYKVQDRDKQAQVDQVSQSFASDAEIWFNMRSVLDNGLVISGRVELEASTYTDQIDERYLILSRSDIGTAEIGSTDRVSGKMLYFAPTALPGHSTTVHSEYTAAAVTPLMWYVNANHDAEGINLYTANDRYFGSKAGKGLQIGVSYVPDGCEDFSQASGAATASVTGGTGRSCGGGFGNSTGTLTGITGSNQISQQWTIGANYVETFGDVGVNLYGSYMTGHQEGIVGAGRDRSVNGWQAGAQLVFDVGGGSTITLGGGYTKEDVESATIKQRKGYSVGVRYLTDGAKTGSIGVGAEWYAREDKAPVTLAKTDYDIITAGLTYQLGPGVLTFIGAGRVDNDQPGAAVDTKQTFGVLGIGVTF
ncbi:porin [Ferrovibrio sp.]|uniref:porin n=1 Tax=Ferrovibrio sp. TaxID=1917215 RepID=UPI0025C4B2E7|nr:porin [Ferrovibrio sp.]MBX3455639.1 porin [Ferrovibrio sp.]